MIKVLAYIAQLTPVANALETLATNALVQGLDVYPSIKGVKLHVRIERAAGTITPGQAIVTGLANGNATEQAVGQVIGSVLGRLAPA